MGGQTGVARHHPVTEQGPLIKDAQVEKGMEKGSRIALQLSYFSCESIRFEGFIRIILYRRCLDIVTSIMKRTCKLLQALLMLSLFLCFADDNNFLIL